MSYQDRSWPNTITELRAPGENPICYPSELSDVRSGTMLNWIHCAFNVTWYQIHLKVYRNEWVSKLYRFYCRKQLAYQSFPILFCQIVLSKIHNHDMEYVTKIFILFVVLNMSLYKLYYLGLKIGFLFHKVCFVDINNRSLSYVSMERHDLRNI